MTCFLSGDIFPGIRCPMFQPYTDIWSHGNFNTPQPHTIHATGICMVYLPTASKSTIHGSAEARMKVQDLQCTLTKAQATEPWVLIGKGYVVIKHMHHHQ